MKVTIEKFQKVYEITEQYDGLTRDAHIISILYDMTIEDVRALTPENFALLVGQVPDMKPPQTLIPEIIIGGKVYKVDTMYKSSGQMIDFTELNKNGMTNLHRILALFAYEEGTEYTKDFEQRAELFRVEAEAAPAQAVAFFFLRLIRELSQSISDYSMAKVETGTQRSGDGWRRLTTLQDTIVQSGLSTLHSIRVRCSRIWPFTKTDKN